RLVADRGDLADRPPGPRQQEEVEMSDVVRLHDEVVRVRREGEPVPDDLHVLRLAVEEGARAALPVRAVLRRVCLLDVEEHASLLVLAACGAGRVGRYTRERAPTIAARAPACSRCAPAAAFRCDLRARTCTPSIAPHA